LIADTPEEFLMQIQKIFEDREYAEHVSRAQMAWYERYLESESENAKKAIEGILKNIRRE
jgi:hypothetical protein